MVSKGLLPLCPGKGFHFEGPDFTKTESLNPDPNYLGEKRSQKLKEGAK